MLKTAVILAGGFGTRLQKVVNDVPKPMAPINKEPFLNYQLRYLKQQGIKKVILSTGYLAHVIKDFYKNSFEGLSVSYAHETEPLGTGGAIRFAMEQCEEEQVVVLNGDSFFDISLKDLFHFHLKQEANVSLALREVANAARYGLIELNQENRITAFREKSGLEMPGLINAGVYILSKSTYFLNTPAGQAFSIEEQFFKTHLSKLRFCGLKQNGYFIDIGIPEDYERAQDDFKRFEHR
jgi:D-glycero-alpha-D-manno-heptose 1-phosphate guanylyltransferase